MRILITGTTSGIGLALSQSLSLEHEVITINRPEYDLSNINSIGSIDLSNIDVLINNAGHSHGGGLGLRTHQVDQWSSIVDVTLKAPILLTQNFIKQNTSGKIIFITSKAVEKALGGDCVYSASKAGLSYFIQCMRDELKDSKFKLVEVRPGRVKTNFAKNRKIHDLAQIDKFYENKQHILDTQMVEVIKHCIDNDIIETITVSK
jgi:NADP-dependent 3-hydroxy acid dehydrogenase YdfG